MISTLNDEIVELNSNLQQKERLNYKRKNERRERDAALKKVQKLDDNLKKVKRNLHHHKNKKDAQLTPKLSTQNVKELIKFLQSDASSNISGTYTS